jgi:signal transduction histidine kinase
VVVEDIAEDPLWTDYRALAMAHGLRACWSTPIFDAQRRVLGTFALYRRQPGAPGERHLRLVETATHTAAIAIARSREEENLRRLNAELEARVRDRTAELEARNRELETFTYSVSHDLKAPLRGMDGYSRLLLEDHADRLGEEGRAFVETIRGAARQMNQLIDDLLAYSRLERRIMLSAQVPLRALVEQLVRERAEEIAARGAELCIEVPDLAVSADADGLTLAIRNLLDNALKFTRESRPPRIELRAEAAAETWRLEVTDNGIGFDARFRKRIFEIFQRLHRAEDYPGTGIGLAIVQKAVERMGGRVWAESEPGRRTSFHLEFPW